MDAETKLLALFELAEFYRGQEHIPEAAIRSVMSEGATFGMDAEGNWHGPKPPGEGWTQSGKGERGGLIWKKSAQQITPTVPAAQKSPPMAKLTSASVAHREEVPPPLGEFLTSKAAPQSPAASKPKPIHDISTPEGRAKAAQILESSPIQQMSPLKGSANSVFVVTTEDGIQGVWKPASGEQPNLRSNIEGGTYWRREIASSKVADAFGMGDLVPATVPRKLSGDGSIQTFVPDNKTAASSLDPYDGGEAVLRAAMFDFVTGNSDRHAGNWLTTQGDDGTKIHLIDNGLSFPESDEKGNYYNAHLIRRAAQQKMVVPDVSEWVQKWPEVAKQLEGLDPAVVKMAERRLSLLAQAKGKTFDQIECPFPGFGNLGEMLDGVMHRKPPHSQFAGEIVRKPAALSPWQNISDFTPPSASKGSAQQSGGELPLQEQSKPKSLHFKSSSNEPTKKG